MKTKEILCWIAIVMAVIMLTWMAVSLSDLVFLFDKAPVVTVEITDPQL